MVFVTLKFKQSTMELGLAINVTAHSLLSGFGTK